jgi:hypothetical protein
MNCGVTSLGFRLKLTQPPLINAIRKIWMSRLLACSKAVDAATAVWDQKLRAKLKNTVV